MEEEHISTRKEISWLFRAVPSLWKWILSLTVVRVIQSVVAVGYAISLQQIVDHAVAGDAAAVKTSIIGFFLLVSVQLISLVFSRYLDEASRSSIENKLKLRLFDNLLCRNYAQVTSVHSGEWMNRLTNDTVVVGSAAAQILPGAAGMISKLLLSAGMLVFFVPELAALMLGGFLLLMVFTVWSRRILKRLHRQIQEKDGIVRIFMTERLSNLIILKAYQQEAAADAEAAELMKEHRSARLRKNHFSNFCNTGFLLVMRFAYVLGAAYCGLGILHGTVGYGTFTAVIHLVSQLQTPIAGLTGFIPQLHTMLASVDRLMEAEFFEQNTEPAVSKQQIAGFRGLELRNVSYAYEDAGTEHREAVSNFSMKVLAGEYAAFSGPSGCGKSTILKILMGLYRPDSGECLVWTEQGPVPLTPAWRQLFAYVPQGNLLMSGSIREVISMAAPEKVYNDAVLWDALHIACAKEFVELLPEGLDTVLGERGCGLSEGQMQRLSVARALLSDRPVLLLDEATSALDGPSEARLLHNLQELTGKTVLIVTHRPAALAIVQKVIPFSEC